MTTARIWRLGNETGALPSSAIVIMPISLSSIRGRVNLDVSFHGIGNEALLVRLVVEVLLLLRRGALCTAVDNPGLEGHGTHPRNTAFVFCHMPDCVVVIALDLESLAPSQVQEREHVAARERGHVGFLGVHKRRIGIRRGHNARRW